MHTKTAKNHHKPMTFQDVVNEFFKVATTTEKTIKTKLYDSNIKANVHELEDGYTINVALPGISKKDVDIEIKEHALTLTVTSPTVEDTDQFLWREYDYGQAKRTFRLSRAIDTESIKAEMSNGILIIKLGKKPAFVPKTIEVK